MNMRARGIGGTWLALIMLTPPNLISTEEPRPSPFAPGETLTYEVTWAVFPAGRVTVTLSSVAEGSADAYEVRAVARSQGFVSLLYNVQNEFQSVFDAQTICSRRITKKIKEGRRRKESEILFDASRRLAILNDRDLTQPNAPARHAENEIPPCVEDVVCAFYFLRRQPLEVGRQFRVPMNDGAKTYDVTVDVQAREQIQTPLGSHLALRVEAKVFGELYKRKGRMLVWFSDDAQRLPLRIKAMISIGAITGNLKSVTTSPLNTPSPRP